MTKFRALLMGSACLGLLMLQASPDYDGRNIADTIKARIAKLQQFGGQPTPVRLAQAENQTGDTSKSDGADVKPAAAPVSAGVTSYYGGQPIEISTPAWGAEATVFDVIAASPAEAPTSAATTETEMAPASAPTSQDAKVETAAPASAGVTSFYGGGAPADGQTFSAPAIVFETVADAPASPAAPAAAPTEALQAAAPEAAKTEAAKGVTSFYGDTSPAESQPFSAPATVFMAIEAKPAQAAPAAAAAKAVEAPKVNYVESKPGPAVPGVTSFYGSTQRAEDQPYSAPAKMIASTPGVAPASKTAESCRDQLSATVQAGRILFANSSFEIRPESFRTLDKLAAIAKGCGGVNIEVGGHTDNTGSPAGNTQLSLLRAQAVVTYLVKEGVDREKLKAVGFGQTSPLASNTTVEGRQKNRRIEFVVSGN